MATITGMTSAAMQAIADGSITAARLSAYHLILTTRGGVDIDVGDVRGAQGIQGPVWVPNTVAVQTVTDSWDTILTQGTHPNLVLGTQPQGPGTGVYYYVTNYTYGGVNGNRTQFAVPYSSGESSPIAWRTRYSGIWSAWTVIAAAPAAPVLPCFRAVKTDNTTKTASGFLRLTSWTTEQYDTSTMFDPTTGFAVTPEAGLYDIQLSVNPGTASQRRFILIETGVAAAGSNPLLGRDEGPVTGYSSMNVSLLGVPLASGVSVSGAIYSDGTNLTLRGDAVPFIFAMAKTRDIPA
jgi:hypothetical protein